MPISGILKTLGFTPTLAAHAAAFDSRTAYRITEDFGRRFIVAGEHDGRLGEFHLEFSHRVTELPIIGDWIVGNAPTGNAVEYVDTLRRTSCFQRANEGGAVQPVAANIDRLFIVTSCTDEFNLSRLERYLLLASATGIKPTIVLNKVDLAHDLEHYVAQIAELGSNVSLLMVSTLASSGVAQLRREIADGMTCAFVGSSGVGKSSLVNALTGEVQQRTLGVSANGARGSHTTTSRSLFLLEGGGAIIDTPGIRSVGVSASAEHLSDAFDDITSLMSACVFRNCSHNGEAGCALAEAVAQGRLTPRRLASFQKLQREVRYVEDPDEMRREQRRMSRKRAAQRNNREKFERSGKA